MEMGLEVVTEPCERGAFEAEFGKLVGGELVVFIVVNPAKSEDADESAIDLVEVIVEEYHGGSELLGANVGVSGDLLTGWDSFETVELVWKAVFDLIEQGLFVHDPEVARLDGVT